MNKPCGIGFALVGIWLGLFLQGCAHDGSVVKYDGAKFDLGSGYVAGYGWEPSTGRAYLTCVDKSDSHSIVTFVKMKSVFLKPGSSTRDIDQTLNFLAADLGARNEDAAAALHRTDRLRFIYIHLYTNWKRDRDLRLLATTIRIGVGRGGDP